MEQQQQQQLNDSSNMNNFEPDPLLQPGAFIDPNPNPHPPTTPPNGVVDKKPNGKKSSSSTTVDPNIPASVDASKPSDQIPVSARPVWLPPDWEFIERVRVNGASAGSRDKYYVCPSTKRRFRSKKEVFYYLETGSTKKRKNADDADSTPATNSTAKGKKSEAKTKKISLNFNFDDVPEKVDWTLTDIYELKWRPLVNGVDRVPESAKQEWNAAFTYLTLHNGGGNTSL